MTDKQALADKIFDPDNPIVIDLDDLTISEQAEVEQLAGLPFSAIIQNDAPNKKLLQALLFVSARKSFPEVTFELAGMAKPHGYGWLLEDTEDGNSTVPLQALLSGSPLSWALSQATTSSGSEGLETEIIGENGETS